MSQMFPFAQGTNSLIPQTINYDLIIQEQFPGIGLQPTVPGGTYQEIRAVNSCLWLVTNATWNPNTLQWEQTAPPCDPSQAAYALEMCQDGSMNRMIAAPTVIAGTAVSFQFVWGIDGNGNATLTPATQTSQSEIATRVNPTWNAGIGAKMIASEINVTDTSSSLDSLFEQFSLGGTPKWGIRKDGTLVVGIVPSALVSPVPVAAVSAGLGITVTTNGAVALISVSHGDYVDLPNPQTITGQKTISTGLPLVLGATSQGGLVGTSVETMWSYGAQFTTNTPSLTFQAHATAASVLRLVGNQLLFYADTGLTPNNTYTPTLRFSVDSTGHVVTTGDVTVNGNEHVTGSLTVDANLLVGGIATVATLDVTGTAVIPQSTFSNALVGVNGISVHPGTGSTVQIDGVGLIETIDSPDSSINVTNTGQVWHVEVNTSSITTAPQKGTGIVAINTGGGGTPATVNIPNTYAGSSAYIALIQLQGTGSGMQATVTPYVNQISGNVFQVYAEGDATAPQNVTFAWVTFAV